jgi:uroporphyrinogen decarboxylase
MKRDAFEKIFPRDVISKRERVELTLRHKPVDRIAIHEQLSYNSKVISLYTGKSIQGFNYTIDDIGEVVRRTTDVHFPLFAPKGTGREVDEYGFTIQHDNWTSWYADRPFNDEKGACEWLKKKTRNLSLALKDNNPDSTRRKYRDDFLDMQARMGETVLFNWSFAGFCDVFNMMGLEIYSFFSLEYPDVLSEFMELSTEYELLRIHAVADRELSPLILIPEDFATRQGPIFSPEFLKKYHYPYVRRLAEAWHTYDISVIYHSDGNYKKAIPDLMECGVDGFYCLEPNCGMDIVELKLTWPEMVWAGGLDGVDLMECGTPEDVRREVHRHIRESNALKTGGMFMATSSEINPPIPAENFRAMIEATGEIVNPDFRIDNEVTSL